MDDTSGVAGFFEDLPVLIFVLAGTLAIVISTLAVSTCAVAVEKSVELDRTTDRCVDLLLSEILGHDRDVLVMVGSVCTTRMCQVAEDLLGGSCFSICIVMTHPDYKWLFQNERNDSCIPKRVSTASRLFNAMTDDGLSAILVVRIVVWQ